MTDNPPVACSLGAADLAQRLAGIAEIGSERLTGRSVQGSRHLLRFRADPTTRRRLEQIVAAESECCPFLDLGLREEGDGELVLSIAAPADAQPLADELAAAFAGART